MKTSQAIVSAVIVAVVLALLFILLKDAPVSGGVRPTEISGGSYTGAPLENAYRNETFSFELSLPEGFSAGELPPDENGGTAIVLQNDSGEGIQIYVMPVDASLTSLSAEDIQASIPDMAIESPEVVEIGNRYRGVAFVSNNEMFSGRSREVWFYYKGNLYQISTYARFDTLLKAMFSTWRFF